MLDPCVALRRTLTVAPGETAALAFGLAGARSRDDARALADRFATDDAVADAIAEAPLTEAACRERLGFDDALAERAQALVGALVYGDPALRAQADVIASVTPESQPPAALDVTGRGPLVAIRVRTAAGERAARHPRRDAGLLGR